MQAFRFLKKSTCPDCSPYNLIPNGDLECNSGNPIGIENFNQVTDWQQATIGTVDYFDLPTLQNTFNSTLTAPPNGSDLFAGTLILGTSYVEYISSCLKVPTVVGNEYHIKIDVGAMDLKGGATVGFDGNIVVLGVTECPTWPVNGSGALGAGEIHSNYDVLVEESITIGLDEWLANGISTSFISDKSYEAIIIGGYYNQNLPEWILCVFRQC